MRDRQTDRETQRQRETERERDRERERERERERHRVTQREIESRFPMCTTHGGDTPSPSLPPDVKRQVTIATQGRECFP